MVALLIQLIVLAIVVAFLYWAWTLIRPLLPLPAPFGQIIDVLVLILFVAIIVFYALIPIIQTGAHMLPIH